MKKLVATGANLYPSADAFRPGSYDRWLKKYNAEKNQVRTTDKEKNAWKLSLLDLQQPQITLDQLHGIQIPSLIVCGDHDLISISHTVLIYQNIKHANLSVVRNSGHSTLIEHADDFDRHADDFFTSPFVDHP